MFCCKFAAYFQNTFLEEYLWRAASERSSSLSQTAASVTFQERQYYIFVASQLILVSFKLFQKLDQRNRYNNLFRS